MTSRRTPEEVLREVLRAGVPPQVLEGFGPDAMARIQAAMEEKAGAPDGPGTPSPTAEKEPTMSHDLTYESTAKGKQYLAALALAHLLERETPGAEWSITEAGKLCGHVKRTVDSEARAALHDFAGFLGLRGVRAAQGRNHSVEWLHLHVEATYRGVPVTVWTHINVRPLQQPAEDRS